MYTRKIDQMGRVILPADFRIKLKITTDTPLEFFIDEEEKSIILMRKDDFEKEE